MQQIVSSVLFDLNLTSSVSILEKLVLVAVVQRFWFWSTDSIDPRSNPLVLSVLSASITVALASIKLSLSAFLFLYLSLLKGLSDE